MILGFMSAIPSLSSRQMRNNTFLVQYSDEIITKSISQAQEENFACGLELLVHFQIGLGFKVIGGLSLVLLSHVGSLVTLFLENLESRGNIV